MQESVAQCSFGMPSRGPTQEVIRTTDQPRSWGYHPITGYFSTTSDSTSAFPWQGQWFPVIRGGGEEDSDSENTEGGTEDDDTSGGTEDDTSGGSEKDEKRFSQAELDAILARQVSKKTRGKLDPKELGFESAKELNEFVAAAKAKQGEEQTEADQALEAAKKEAADTARAEVLSKADERLIYAEFKLAASDAGIRRDAIGDAFVIAQRLGKEDWAVEVSDDGEVSGIDEDLFTTLKEKKPFLFAEDSEEDEDEGAGNIGARAGGKSKATANRADELRKKYPALSGTKG